MKTDQGRTLRIVEVIPLQITPKVDAKIPVGCQDVVVADLLPLPQHRDTGSCVQRNDERLNHVPTRSIDCWLIRVLWVAAQEGDQMAVVVAVEILEWCDRHFDRVARAILDGLATGITDEVGVKE